MPPGVLKASSYVLKLKPMVLIANRFEIIAGREHPKYVFNRESTTSNNRLTTEYLRIDRNSL
jgi:hypothetical protein